MTAEKRATDAGAIDSLSPAEHRARYLELKRVALAGAVVFDPAPATATQPEPLDAADIVARATIAGGWYWSGRLARGQTLRIVNTSGTAGVSAFFWNADDPSERYNAGDTVKVQWNARLCAGRLLLSDMGRALLTIAADTSGRHDTLLGGSTRATAGRADTAAPHPRNTRENFLLAAAKHGLGKRDIAPCITFFADVRTTDDGRFAWYDDPAPVDRHVDLRAEMNVLAVLSNCPHPLAPVPRAAGAVTATIVRARGGVAQLPDRFRTAEAGRALENTAVLFCS